MTRKRIDLRLDDELVARVDARAGELGQTRTKFVERALEQALGVLHPHKDADARAASSPAPARASGHLPTCRCPVCKPVG